MDFPSDSPLRTLQEKIDGLKTPEEKIAQGLAFLRDAVSQEGTPHFREFWEARRLVLPFFKENLNPIARAKLWEEYVELTVEARRLKEILEEQSGFAMEQIDLAIQALEKDLSNFEGLLAQIGEISFPQESPSLQQRRDFYHELQRKLYLLNTLANRLTALRKEILKTDMRIRFKTKFFKRLSELGDQIFPERKTLIEQISAAFEKDVEQFVQAHFREDQVVGAPYYALREEIKALQTVAKVFTLNSSTFSHTRLRLSECWDRIKELEKERKLLAVEKRQASSEQREALQAKVEDLKARAAEMTLPEIDREIRAFLAEMRSLSLEKEEVRALREGFEQLRAPHMAAAEEKRREREEEFRRKREKIAAVKEQVSTLLKERSLIDLEQLTARVEEIQQEIQQLEMSKGEKTQLERQIRPIKDTIADRKEQALLNLSEDEKKMLENLHLILEQKRLRRKEIKEQLEQYRKFLGTSGLDFEKAMLYRELIDQERERLDVADRAMEEVEQKIAELE